MISIGIYKQGQDLLIGACDEQLIGKTFVEGNFHLKVKKEFYGGNRINIAELRNYLKRATIANLVGEKTVSCAIQMGLIDPDCVLTIKGIPHAQMVRML